MNPEQDHAEILTRLCSLAAEQAAVDPTAVSPDSDFFADLNFDSLDAVEFVMKVEDQFDVSIDDQQAQGIRTPRQAFTMLLTEVGRDQSARDEVVDGPSVFNEIQKISQARRAKPSDDEMSA